MSESFNLSPVIEAEQLSVPNIEAKWYNHISSDVYVLLMIITGLFTAVDFMFLLTMGPKNWNKVLTFCGWISLMILILVAMLFYAVNPAYLAVDRLGFRKVLNNMKSAKTLESLKEIKESATKDIGDSSEVKPTKQVLQYIDDELSLAFEYRDEHELAQPQNTPRAKRLSARRGNIETTKLKERFESKANEFENDIPNIEAQHKHSFNIKVKSQKQKILLCCITAITLNGILGIAAWLMQ